MASPEPQGPPVPYVSIVIATFNAGATLERCLRSITGQTSRDWEILIADGGSRDETLAILDSHSSDIAWRISEPDRGIYSAWNKALPHVRGTWVLFLGADDRLHSEEVLGEIAPILRDSEDTFGIVYGKLNVVDESGHVMDVLGSDWSEARSRLGKGMVLPHPATFHHSRLFRELGSFDESFRIAGDYEFVLRELVHRQARYAGNVVVSDMGSDGMSSQVHHHLLMGIENHEARRRHGLAHGPAWADPHVTKLRLQSLLRNRLGTRTEARVRRIYRLMTGRSRAS